ncbi:MAG: thrombospondin type 3 repeat-containing protein, partial [Kiritimatiellia bacterium]
MDANTIRDAYQHVVLVGCVVGLWGLAIVSLAMWARRAPKRVGVLAKRFGWGTVAMLFSLGVWATINGYPTQEDKDDHNSQQQQMSQVNVECRMENEKCLDGGSVITSNVEKIVGIGSVAPILHSSFSILNLDMEPSVRNLTAEDYATGLALSRIETDESHDFSAPPCAEVCEDWRSFGSSLDWFRTDFTNGWGFALGTNRIDALTVFSYGTARPKMRNKTTFFSPLESNLGVVPEANWYALTNEIPSLYWQCLTPSNTFVMTWQNVLLDRRSCSPVSFQMEFEESGDITFRYDLANVKWGMENGEWVENSALSNVCVGVMNNGLGRVFNALPTNVTSLKWSRLDPTRSDEPDPDGDGITTDDELLVYHTDPYAADSDMDGLSDGEEIFETNTDSNNPHSLSDIYCDGVAVKIEDLDPFVCPEGSTNTIWEHVFYTGTTNAPFAYPQSTDDTAVLRVS